MDIEKVYKDSGALLEGHFILSSGNHSRFYLQSAKVLEQPQTAEMLAKALAQEIRNSEIHIDTVVAPALGGILAGYELARALGVRSLFVERKEGKMELRRGFEISQGEKILICEDIITTGGSAMEAMEIITQLGGEVVAFGALANRGFCKRVGSDGEAKLNCKLPCGIPFFALGDFEFEIYSPEDCPMCKEGSQAIKPGSRNA
ncbi:MAG: orotate phosphoribosyltransferase [Epsilonproteobacteria bacterium]|nr:orotate phosphoribosyltransferase [Campylobacterota bacterium]MBD3839143.1 orotate phosphoribosyltransferase [Campylobacterota bacterium]